MSAKTEVIQVGTFPGVKAGQALLVATALVSSLLGLILGRASGPAGAERIFNSRDLSAYSCTGHVPTHSCLWIARVAE